MGVQAEGSSYLAQAWAAGEDVLHKPPVEARTVADSISAGLPRDRLKAMAAVRETAGAYVTVSDKEILAAVPRLGRTCGVFAEPAGAAALAGLVKALDGGRIGPEERIVVLSTGNGLKDVAGAMQAVDMAGVRACRIRPEMDDLKRALKAQPGFRN
jgi:threonine synthase